MAEQVTLLSRYGHRVELLERSSAELTGAGGRARAGRALLRGGEHEHEVASAVSRLGADVVHAHNLHPTFGFRALEAARAAGARTVLQLHNFRLFCAIGVAYRDGEVCHRCTGRNTLAGVRLRCRGQLAESAVYALALARQQPRILSAVDRFITLSESTRLALGASGLPLARADVVSNPLSDTDFSPVSEAHRGDYALCVGRLVEEKGFDVAVAAATAAGVPLRIVGSGPDEARLRTLAAGADVELLGHLEGQELARSARGRPSCSPPRAVRSRAPTPCSRRWPPGCRRWYPSWAGCPSWRAGTRAFHHGTSARGRAPWHAAGNDPERRRLDGEAALARALERAAPERVHGALMDVYRRAGVSLEAAGVQA